MFYLCLFQREEEQLRTIDLSEANTVVFEPNQPLKGNKKI